MRQSPAATWRWALQSPSLLWYNAIMREKIVKALTAALEKSGITAAEVVLEHPGTLENGDFASGVALQYAKQAGKAPRALAEELVAALSSIEGVAKVEVAGAGFINFYLSTNALASTINEAIEQESWGGVKTYAGKKIMVEYTDPNPFKEFHIGHLMSNAIGESLARLFHVSGGKVIRANYQGDVGPHVAKAIWALMKNAGGTPTVQELAVAYTEGTNAYETNDDAKAEIDTINKQLYEKSNGGLNMLYEHGRKVSLEHFEELYKILGTKFDFYFFESDTGPRGVSIVKAHPEIFEESEGATVFKGEKYGLHTRVFLNKAGLPTYEAKELGLAEVKKERTTFDTSITVTAHEQSDYFKVVLQALELVHPDWKGQYVHVSHGMMRFAEGKMSSRKGNVVTGESLIEDLTEAAKERAKESRAADHEQLARDVAVAAIKYQILKQASGKDIIFDQARALSLEGDSGPYLQYAYARTRAIVEKAASEHIFPRFDEQAAVSDIARFVRRFPEIVERAAEAGEPHHVATYLIELASRFNSWYAVEHILDGSSTQAHKVALTSAVASTLHNGLWILGIPTPEKM